MAAKVSVIIPTCNRSELLQRSLRSVVGQSYADTEVVVVDDSSAEATREANRASIREICPNAVYIRLPAEKSGRGPGFPRNEGIERCAGGYVAFLDDDDEWIDPTYLETAVAAMLRHGYDVHFADQAAMHPDGSLQPPPIWTEDWGPRLRQVRAGAAGDGSYLVTVDEALCSDGFAHLNTTIVSIGLLRDGLRGFDLRITYEEDRELYFRLVDQAKAIGYTPRTVARHYIPAGSSRVSASNTVPDEEKDASRLRWLDNLIATAAREPVRRRSQRERGYTLKRITLRTAGKGDVAQARRYGREALRASFGCKWLAYLAWLEARHLSSFSRVSLPPAAPPGCARSQRWPAPSAPATPEAAPPG